MADRSNAEIGKEHPNRCKVGDNQILRRREVNRKGSHAELFYHFVWSTKSRTPMIDDQIEPAVKSILYSKAKELQLEIIEADGTSDHLHLLVKGNPSIAPADIAKHMKGSSSHFVNHVTLKGDSLRTLYWQDGYGVTSVSPGAVSAVGRYIRRQKEHHNSNTLQEDLERSEGIAED
jgi:putative transposase